MPTNLTEISEIVPISVEEELQRSYLDYAMSVIVSRALPDVRDGLKPVHRRILYTMKEEGFDCDKPYKKSARIVGQVVSKYHPHGTDPIYGAMVRLAQDFSMRIPLVDGHGNYGSMDGDEAADMRYTEARLAEVAHSLLEDYDKETVDFQPNYDDTLLMPMVLPAGFPNLLVNGASGIAVGMATNIPPHHLGEVIDACCFLIDHPDAELSEIMEYIKGPDFPTGGLILGVNGIRDGYTTGRGSFVIRARTHIEEFKKDREAIIVTEIPYQVNKATMIQRIAELVNQKEIDGISDLRDESDRNGVRVVIELKKDSVPDVILNRLYAMSSLQVSFGMNMLALHQNRPLQMGLKTILKAFIDFRKDVVIRRTQFFLRKAQVKADLLIGLVVAVYHIDEVIALIKSSTDAAQALTRLMEKTWPIEGIVTEYLKRLNPYDEVQTEADGSGLYRLSEDQAKGILALRLQRLTGMERDHLYSDLEKLLADIQKYAEILGSEDNIFHLMKTEMKLIKDKFSTPRKTDILTHLSADTDIEDMIPCEDMVVTVSVKGYIKRVPLSTYKSQKRGGRGRQAMSTRDEDEVAKVFVADTHTLLLFFTSFGQAYQLKVHELPLGVAQSKGKPLVGLFPLNEGETLATLLPLPKNIEGLDIVFVTSRGNIRKNSLDQFTSIRANGKIAIRLGEGEKLVGVSLVSDDQDILLSARNGKSIRFSTQDLRQFSSRQSTGVRGMMLKPGDAVVAMSVLSSLSYTADQIDLYLRRISELRKEDDTLSKTNSIIEGEEGSGEGSAVIDDDLFESMQAQEEFILSISSKGFGKRTSCYAYRRTHRGGQGIATMEVTEKTGLIVNAIPVKEEDELLILSDKGQLMRCSVSEIRISARRTQGVRLFRLSPGEEVISVAVFPAEEESVKSYDAEITEEKEESPASSSVKKQPPTDDNTLHLEGLEE